MMNNLLEARAEKLLDEANCYSNKPLIDLECLCKHLKLRVEAMELEKDVSGFLAMTNGNNVIGYNKNHVIERQRFTIAHEISHFILHAKTESPLFIDKDKNPEQRIMFRDAASSTGEFIQEREANAFAAALLMPKKLVEQEINSSNKEDIKEVINVLADKFQVSSQAMGIRLANLEIIDYGV